VDIKLSDKIVYTGQDTEGNESTFYASGFAECIEFAIGDTFETAQKGLRFVKQ
jgi:hypothetical protein